MRKTTVGAAAIVRLLSLYLALTLCLALSLCLLTGCSGGSDGDTGNASKAVSVELVTEKSEDGYSGKGVLTGFDEDGNELWTFETGEFQFTELLFEASEFGEHNGMYYVFGDALYGVDAATGREVWKCEDYPGVVSGYDFDDTGNMYACGYYRPSLAVITPEGELKYCYDKLNISGYDPDEFYHAYSLDYVDDNKVIIQFESNNTTVEADPQTGDAFLKSGDKTAPSDTSSSATYTAEEICMIAADTYYRQNGERPPMAAVDSVNGNIVTVHLYEDMGDHIATWAWYEINLNDMTGKDAVTGETFDLVY